MPLYYGDTQVKELYYNNTKVKEMYYNNTLVYKSSILDGTLAVGNTVTFDNKSWIVVHNSGNQWYLTTPNIIELIVYGNSNSNDYNGSTLANRCVSWMNENLSDAAQAYMQDVTVESVTAKVFIPTSSQLNGEFSYYNSNSRRICKYQDTASTWWSSSKLYGNASYVMADGILYSDIGWNTKKGFRPHICIQL